MVEVAMPSNTGSWLDKKTLVNGDIIKIVTEADWIESQKGGDQLACKVLVKGKSKEPETIAINSPSRAAFIKAFGKDSKDWIDKVVTAYPKETVVAGKMGTALYLVPDGFELTTDDNNFLVIKEKDALSVDKSPDGDYPDDDINPEDIPF